MSRITTDWTVWQDEQIVAAFANDRRGGILGASQQLEVLQQLLPPEPVQANRPLRVLDLGCGDGILLETVLRHWPQAQGIALDGSEAMLERAKQKLTAFGDAITFVLSDFNTPGWQQALPFTEFDAIVSGFAIHHSEDDRKRAHYAEIFDLLSSGGVFVNVEHVASATPLGEELFERAYALNILRQRQKRGEDITFEKVLDEIHNRLDKSANRLTPVETQLAWLRGIGYTDVDCYWKHYELAILAGYKPASKTSPSL
jgi:tRNA (cmo5U34)-methyltransferase